MFERFDLFARLRHGSARRARADRGAAQIQALTDKARDERRSTDASDLYAEYLTLEPSHAPIWVQYGHCLKEGGDLDSAEKAYRRSLMLASEVPDTLLQLGRMLRLRGDQTGAVGAFRRALELDLTYKESSECHYTEASGELEIIVSKGTGAPGSPPPIPIDELTRVANAFIATNGSPEGEWLEFRGRNFALPRWFQFGMDPCSPEYREQQIALWREISGVPGDYVARQHELSGSLDHFDIVRQPGFYHPRGAGAVASASEQLIALGHILKHLGVSSGDWVLEYGAGFGQIALAFARLGVSVDTVDIEPTLCAAVRKQAEFFAVNLTAFEGEFGFNPRDGHKYNLILFYESFHHCLDFLALIPRLRSFLAPGGRIILGGEPLTSIDNPIVPYPWGIRLDAECVAVVRIRGWFELGFHEAFLVSQFIREGFVWQPQSGCISQCANLHIFTRRPDVISLGAYSLPDASGWHHPQPQEGGRFTREVAYLPVDCTGGYERLVLRLHNYHPRPIEVSVRSGAFSVTQACAASENIEIPAGAVESPLCITAETISPASYGHHDGRTLGIFVEALEYAPAGAG